MDEHRGRHVVHAGFLRVPMRYSSARLRFHSALRPEDPEADVVSAWMFDLGAEGIEWQEGACLEMVASFREGEQSREALAEQIETKVASLASLVRVEPIEPIDWSTHWQTHFQPLSFGSLWIVPSWLKPPEEAEQVLCIDPSSAFGTGLHPTTHLCIEALVRDRPRRVLDAGTGTGILALAAVRSGATAVGFDNDPEAIRVAMENRDRNEISSHTLELFTGEVADVKDTFPYVVANILAGPLESMAPSLAARVDEGGTLVLSGLLEHQTEAIRQCYGQEGLRLLDRQVRYGSGPRASRDAESLQAGGDEVEAWVALEFRR